MAQASWTTVTANPRSAAARAVASTHMLVIIPQTITSSTPSERRVSSSGVSRKLFGWAFWTTVSPGRGATVSWISTPGVPGRMNDAPGAAATC